MMTIKEIIEGLRRIWRGCPDEWTRSELETFIDSLEEGEEEKEPVAAYNRIAPDVKLGENYNRIAPDVKLGVGVRIYGFTNLYGCEIGDETRIGAFVEIQKGARVGPRCKISSHTFICEGVTIEANVFVGHGVTFINDSRPKAVNIVGKPATEADWTVEQTLVEAGASIGSGATILGGITIGKNALVGAGSVVTKDVPPGMTVVGNPARFFEESPKKEKLLVEVFATEAKKMKEIE
jgi:acetyltransferase-like isoleucine patch superfamily enzyme